MYLVEGSKEAMLIDTGVGEGNLKALVEELTSKHVKVLLTHGHLDHAAGIDGFAEIYMNSLDEYTFDGHMDITQRQDFLKSKNCPPEVLDELREVNKPDFIDVREGDTFDLGGITLEIFEVPGHTPGSIAILFQEERILLLGDCCNTFTFLLDEYSPTVETYKRNLKKLLNKVEGRYEQVFISHRTGMVSQRILHTVIDVCDLVMEGKSAQKPYHFLHRAGLVAVMTDNLNRRLDGKEGNIVYWQNKIFDEVKGFIIVVAGERLSERVQNGMRQIEKAGFPICVLEDDYLEPQIFIKAAKHLGISTLSCVVATSSLQGIDAAKAVSCKVIAVGDACGYYRADAEVQDFSEIIQFAKNPPVLNIPPHMPL